MTRKTKGRAGGHQATPKASNNTHNFTGLAPRIKAAIVTLALWGWLPITLANGIIRLEGLCDA